MELSCPAALGRGSGTNKKSNEPAIVIANTPARILLSYPACLYTVSSTIKPTAAAKVVIKNITYKKKVAK